MALSNVAESAVLAEQKVHKAARGWKACIVCIGSIDTTAIRDKSRYADRPLVGSSVCFKYTGLFAGTIHMQVRQQHDIGIGLRIRETSWRCVRRRDCCH